MALTGALLLGASALAACGDDAVQSITGTLPGSRVKFFNFGIGAPGVNFYANDQKMTAIQSTTGAESTTGTNPGQAGAAGLYTAINPGQYTLAGKIAAATDKDVAISSAPATLADGKAYSYFISGIYNAATKQADSFVIEDPLPPQVVDFTVSQSRFVNAVPNATAPLAATVTIEGGTAQPLGGAVAYKAAGAFVPVANGVYTITVTPQGSSTALVTRTGVSLVGGRVYTIAVRGDATLPSTGTSANRPQIDVTANR